MIYNLFSGSKLPFEGPHFPSDCILHGPHQHMRSCPAELRNSFCKSYRIAGDSMLEDRYSRDQQRSAKLVTACHSLCLSQRVSQARFSLVLCLDHSAQWRASCFIQPQRHNGTTTVPTSPWMNLVKKLDILNRWHIPPEFGTCPSYTVIYPSESGPYTEHIVLIPLQEIENTHQTSHRSQARTCRWLRNPSPWRSSVWARRPAGKRVPLHSCYRYSPSPQKWTTWLPLLEKPKLMVSGSWDEAEDPADATPASLARLS